MTHTKTIKFVMTTENMYEYDDFIINLTIDGTEFKDVEVKVTDPNKTIREQINSIVSVFGLPKIDSDGNPIQYLLGLVMAEGEEPEILELQNEDGYELSIVDYNVQPGDFLHLIEIPTVGMATEELYEEDDFIINLTIDGTKFKEVEVKVTDPSKTIREQIDSIVSVFGLPKINCGGNPIQYLLGQIMNEGEEPEILELEDEDGREQALIDYNIQSGDFLHLIEIPTAGYACPIPSIMEKEWELFCNK